MEIKFIVRLLVINNLLEKPPARHWMRSLSNWVRMILAPYYLFGIFTLINFLLISKETGWLN